MVSRFWKLSAVLVLLGLIASGCSSDSDDGVASGGEGVAETSGSSEAEPDSEDEAEAEAGASEGEPEPEAPSHALAEPTDITTTCAPSAVGLSRQVALDQGYFASRNVNLECAQIGSGPELAAALVGGEAQYSANIHINTIPMVAGGADVVSFFQVQDRQLFDIVVDKDFAGLAPEGSSWEEVIESLAGTRVGVIGRGAASEDIVRLLFDEAGVDADDLIFIAIGLDTIPALVADSVDWALVFDPGLLLAESLGEGVRPFQLQNNEGPASASWPGLILLAGREWLGNNGDVACAIVGAHTDAAEFMHDPANRDAVIASASAMLPFVEDPAVIEAIVDQYSSGFSATGSHDPAMVELIGQIAVDSGKADTVLTAADYIVDPGC